MLYTEKVNNNDNNSILIINSKFLYVHLVFQPFSCCCTHLSPADLGPRVGGFSLVVVLVGCYGVSLGSGVLCWEEYNIHVDGFFFLTLGSTWGHFMFPSTFFQLCLSSWLCSSTLHLNLLYMLPFPYVKYFFIFFVSPKPIFVHLQICISLTIGELFIDMGSSVPAHPTPHPMSPPLFPNKSHKTTVAPHKD